MKSIKPGRGPSQQAAVGSIFSVIFGVIWTVIAFGIGAGAGPIGLIFPLFGLVFIGLGIYNAVYHHRNATGENRTSLMDIVDSEEEPDPLDPQFDELRFSERAPDAAAPAGEKPAYCPWCGQALKPGFAYCPKCGRKLHWCDK